MSSVLMTMATTAHITGLDLVGSLSSSVVVGALHLRLARRVPRVHETCALLVDEALCVVPKALNDGERATTQQRQSSTFAGERNCQALYSRDEGAVLRSRGVVGRSRQRDHAYHKRIVTSAVPGLLAKRLQDVGADREGRIKLSVAGVAGEALVPHDKSIRVFVNHLPCRYRDE
eukprot:scaffold3118_cov264-Pinguiococcus_pyrenoidosus.AAC.1